VPRKPAPLELAGGKGARQRIWDLIRACKGREFERLEVIPGDVPNNTARTYLTGLEKGGYIGLAGERKGAHKAARVRRYVLLRDEGAEAPRVKRDGTPVTQGLAQEQMWRTLRTLKGDTNAHELAAHASTPAVPVEPVAADSYLRTLRYAGYMACTQEGRPGGRLARPARYRLISNTGPRPPMVCRADAVYDPNLGKTVWIRPVTEEDAIYG
jgi:hypothetical protein